MNEITVQKRTLTKNKVKQLLNDGMVPAVLYNSKLESTNIKVEQGEAERLIQNASTSTILDIKLEDKTVKGVIKEVDIDPVKGTLRHVAFFEIDPQKESLFDIPVVLTGVSNAVKNNLGVLVQPTKALQVRCKLADVVEQIEIDISGLDNPGDSIILRDIELPEGMTLPNDDQYDNALALISELQKLEVIEETEVAEGEEELDEEGNVIEHEEGEEEAEGSSEE